MMIDDWESHDSIGKDVLQRLVQELKLLPKPWPALSQEEQELVISRARKMVSSAIFDIVAAVAGAGAKQKLGVILSRVVLKGGEMQIVLDGMPGDKAAQHMLVDVAPGDRLFLVLMAQDTHLDGMDDVHGEADQRTLAIDEGRADD